MLFNSFDFAVFLPIVFLFYWAFTNRNLKLQNFLLVAASYVFYGWWDWKFLSLIFFSTLVDYSVGWKLKTENNKVRRKLLLWISILVNLGFLGFFKYFNFFLDNFKTAFSFFGAEIHASSLNIILPVGISFYTFQTLSYTIDVYKRKLEPTRDFIAFSAFVSFFPQLVAGPIERATNFLPQFYKKRVFDYSKAVDGMRQILWGLFKKMVIADNCAIFANQIFNNSDDFNGSTLFLGVMFFTFQIYADFSGYSDIALGTARLFGFNLKQNFAYPYFSRNFKEAWRRWHISLTTWFRDYLFIPLVKSYPINSFTKVINVFILFIVIGFWHGANWTFILCGALHALYYIPTLFSKNKQSGLNVIAQGKLVPDFKEFRSMMITFSLTSFSMIMFRAENTGHAFRYISGLVSTSLFDLPEFTGMRRALLTIILTGVFVLIEWVGRERQYAISHLGQNWNRLLRWSFYSLIIFLIGMFKPSIESPFIYFQF